MRESSAVKTTFRRDILLRNEENKLPSFNTEPYYLTDLQKTSMLLSNNIAQPYLKHITAFRIFKSQPAGFPHKLPLILTISNGSLHCQPLPVK